MIASHAARGNAGWASAARSEESSAVRAVLAQAALLRLRRRTHPGDLLFDHRRALDRPCSRYMSHSRDNAPTVASRSRADGRLTPTVGKLLDGKEALARCVVLAAGS
jgi:hypothetical protein